MSSKVTVKQLKGIEGHVCYDNMMERGRTKMTGPWDVIRLS